MKYVSIKLLRGAQRFAELEFDWHPDIIANADFLVARSKRDKALRRMLVAAGRKKISGSVSV